MTGPERIIAIGAGSSAVDHVSSQPEADEELKLFEPEARNTEWPDEVAGRPALAVKLTAASLVAAALAWTLGFGWSQLSSSSNGMNAKAVTSMIVDWSVPMILLGICWLLLMRNSRREAVRFGDVARLLATESGRLETRLTTVNRELSLTREFIAAQSRDLEALGRIASERLSHNAQTLQSLISDNGKRIDSIGAVSAAALENMEKLRSQLPVIVTSAKDLTNNIANAGHVAHGQIEEMAGSFKKLNDFGQACGAEVMKVRQVAEDTIAEFQRHCAHMEEAVTTRFAAITETGTKLRTELEVQEVDALSGIRARATALGEELAQARMLVKSGEEAGLASLRDRLAALREESSAVSLSVAETAGRTFEDLNAKLTQYDEQSNAVLATFGSTVERLAETAQAHFTEVATASQRIDGELTSHHAKIAEIAEQGTLSQTRISDSLLSITNSSLHAQTLIAKTGKDVTDLTEASVRLLELIQASASHSRDELPGSLEQAETRLSLYEGSLNRLREALDQTAGKSEAIGEGLTSSDETLAGLISKTSELTANLDGQSAGRVETFASMMQSLEDMDGKCEQLASKARNELSAALEHLSHSAHEAVAAIGDKGALGISELADRLGSESADAIERAVRNAAAEASGKLEQAVSHAAGMSREAMVQLRDQLAKVDELVGNLEQRVTHARTRAEEQVDNDFARRVALITESLNSNAIDIAKALSTEVSDVAWASYLRGDRGIFTRRAVALIDANEAKAIQQIYERDPDFREHVSRYIHDFEAILRQVLSTRDGHALGVTLLSSDMGKLYVALAQGIERLRD